MEEKERLLNHFYEKPRGFASRVSYVQSYLFKDSRRLSISPMQAPQSVPA